MIEGVGGTLEDLAALIHETIILVNPSRGQQIPKEEHNILCMAFYFWVKFDNTILLPRPPAGELLPLCIEIVARNNAVKSLTLALYMLTHTTLDPGTVIKMVTSVLVSILTAPGGYHKIPNVARHGIPHAFVEAGIRRLLDNRFRYLLVQSFAPATIYYTVLRGISEVFSEAHAVALSGPFCHSPMFKEWSNFADLPSSRLDIMQHFDAQNGVSQRGCDNPKVCFLQCCFERYQVNIS
jgi:hypothetical protein